MKYRPVPMADAPSEPWKEVTTPLKADTEDYKMEADVGEEKLVEAEFSIRNAKNGDTLHEDESTHRPVEMNGRAVKTDDQMLMKLDLNAGTLPSTANGPKAVKVYTHFITKLILPTFYVKCE